jgi:hypothetical protein
VLPVSEIVLPVAVADAGEDVDEDADGLGELELQAAASKVSGIKAAAVYAKRIFFAT